MKDPSFSNEISDEKYELFKEAAHDLSRQGKYYFTNEDIINAVKNKYPHKKSGGSVTKDSLEQQFKLNNIIEIPRRKHG